jgi:adenine-specific DNA-methyltransferase
MRIVLVAQGLEDHIASRLAAGWIRQEDFIRAPIDGSFTHVAGNPPYIRWSKIPAWLRTTYERELPNGIARGDLCVPFLYQCVKLLEPSARMGFVCSDRWLRSEYGGVLRRVLHELVCLDIHLELHSFAAFDTAVDAYAAISVLERLGNSRRKRLTRFAEPCTSSELASCARALASGSKHNLVRRIGNPLEGRAPIVVADGELERAIRRIPTDMPLIEAAGCRIRVGAALGHAPAFVCPESDCQIEPDLLVRYASSSDIQDDGTVRSDRFVVNPFQTDGSLIDLKHYPKFRRRLMKFKSVLSKRYCVKRPTEWFRTIDIIDPTLAASSKILIAGIAKRPRLAVDPGCVQPGNSVYAILSDEWPIAALYRLLQSGILGMFVAGYSPRMSGGFLRFHKAVLRNIRIPGWAALPGCLRRALSDGTDEELRHLVASHYNVPDAVLTRYR